jgi:hypothetical protein
MKRLLLGALIAVFAYAQPYTVRREWVQADEAFLASDALQGRGSMTRDEEIAATYIASQFESFGLKPAPGMPDKTTGYVQPIELSSFQLDGKAVLQAGDKVFHEGQDFYIATSSGASVTGKIPDVLKSQPTPFAIQEATQPQLERFAAGAGTRTPTTIKGVAGSSVFLTRVLAKSGVMAALKEMKDSETVSLTVQATPVSKFTHNAIAMLRGTDPSAGTILITSHLDHLGIGAPVDGDSIYNGANDDASGTTAVLEIARALAAGPAPKRNVLFVCFGSEEAGGSGARWFRENPPVPLEDISANLEFEMIGVAQEGVPKGTMFLTGYERSNFGPVMKEHGALISADPFPQQMFFQRSDNYALAQKGVIAHTAAAGGQVPTYHRPNDDLDHIDLDLMTQLIQSMIEPLRWLANSDFRPEWNPGGKP